jgi:hypothetical protein
MLVGLCYNLILHIIVFMKNEISFVVTLKFSFYLFSNNPGRMALYKGAHSPLSFYRVGRVDFVAGAEVLMFLIIRSPPSLYIPKP